MFYKINLKIKLYLTIVIALLFFYTGKLLQDVEFFSFSNKSNDAVKLLLVSAPKGATEGLLLSTQWSTEKLIQIITKTERQDFPKELVKIFPKNVTIQEIVFTYVFKNSLMKAETLKYKYIDTMSIRRLWERVEFAKILEKIQKTDAPEILVQVKGWVDEIITTDFEDPKNENKALYKLKINLLPGINSIYISASQKKVDSKLIEINYSNEVTPGADRENRFHNSEFELGCTPCHDGLPSSNNGEEITADCISCHKEFFKGNKIHSPVEMNECANCHLWSKDKNAVVVNDGVPASCSNCHSEIVTRIENSKCPHAVGSECLTCHSPHSSKEKKLLKNDVFVLCKSCHEGYEHNHPVSNHPVRLRYLNEEKSEIISCASCHNPHGSDNMAMIKVSGGRMATCLSCHNK